MSADYYNLAREARRNCGCVMCQGGYEVGARTVAMGVPSDGGSPPVREERPASCLAPTILRLLAEAR